jgi:hypothetical protein
VRRGGCDQQRLDRRADDRAAGREAVGGGTGGRGRDHRVGRVADERLAADPDRHDGAALARDADHDHVVEGGEGHRADRRVEGQARLDGEVLAVDGRQRSGQVGNVDLGKEPEFAEVDPEDRGPLPVRQPHRPQHRPVPAQADQQVAAAAELLGRDRGRRAVQPPDLVPDPQDLSPVTGGPPQHCRYRFGRITSRMQDKPDGMHSKSLPITARAGTAWAVGTSQGASTSVPLIVL